MGNIKNKLPSRRTFHMVVRPLLHLSQSQDRPFQDFQACCIPLSLERPYSLICIFGIVVITRFTVCWRTRRKPQLEILMGRGRRDKDRSHREMIKRITQRVSQ